MKARWTKPRVMLFFACGLAFSARADALDNWSIRSSGTTATLRAAAFGNDNFVLVGAGSAIVTSTNGLNWVNRSLGNPYRHFLCASFGEGVFFTGTTVQYPLTNIIVSTNSLNWLGMVQPANAEFWGASHAGGLYLMVGSSMTIMTATNLDAACAAVFTNCSWVVRNSGGDGYLNGVAYGNGTYVAVGDFSSMTSTNAIMWSSNYVASRLFDVAFGSGVFAAVGNTGIFTSSNGVAWTKRYVGAGFFVRVAFGNGTFVAVGDPGTILTSTDGVAWKKRIIPTSSYLTGVAFGKGTFIATGANGTIVQSADVAIPSLFARKGTGGGVALALTGEIGRGYRVQVSTNLVGASWDDFLSFTNTAPTMEFLDTSVTNLPARFYRAISP